MNFNSNNLQNIVIKSRINNNTTKQNLEILKAILNVKCKCGEYKINLHGSTIIPHIQECSVCKKEYCEYLCIGINNKICFNCLKEKNIPIKVKFANDKFTISINYKLTANNNNNNNNDNFNTNFNSFKCFDYFKYCDYNYIMNDIFLNIQRRVRKKIMKVDELLEYIYKCKTDKGIIIKKLYKIK